MHSRQDPSHRSQSLAPPDFSPTVLLLFCVALWLIAVKTADSAAAHNSGWLCASPRSNACAALNTRERARCSRSSKRVRGSWADSGSPVAAVADAVGAGVERIITRQESADDTRASSLRPCALALALSCSSVCVCAAARTDAPASVVGVAATIIALALALAPAQASCAAVVAEGYTERSVAAVGTSQAENKRDKSLPYASVRVAAQ